MCACVDHHPGCVNADPTLNCGWCTVSSGSFCLNSLNCPNPQDTCEVRLFLVPFLYLMRARSSFLTTPLQDSVAPYVPPPCESDEDCSDKGHCEKSEEGNYCVCENGERGVDCGGGGLSDLGKALAISGGIIALLVIIGIVVLALLVFGSKRGVDFFLLRWANMAAAHENPTYVPGTQEAVNPIHE
jgi:hypothetical protein